ncbi:MAG TPA: hypothetical protein DEA90_16165 [Opitutae bacterium]|nr:hypothetical protein [Puniceicoccaceae bacterium]HBR95692.1 hypothetical protein [Opitutae bacterium]|tara:strand:- start:4095 stop:5102 length:1008 start_codon:yes stop_codon:yes gene_type:complete
MSDFEIDSPFHEKKSSRLVWIVPSVVLHVFILIIWLLLPEAPPRKPTDRALMINSAQAEQLQRHVEDANLVALKAQVSQLQAIKGAMAQIRESRMTQLRSFEEQMLVEAPKGAPELFVQLLDAQTSIIPAYQEMLDIVRVSIEKGAEAQVLLEAKRIEAVRPQLVQVKAHWDDARMRMDAVERATAQISALVNTADVRLEWVLDPVIEKHFSQLKESIEGAHQANSEVRDDLNRSFFGRSYHYLNDLVKKNERFIWVIETAEQARIDGVLEDKSKQWLKKEVERLNRTLSGIFVDEPEVGLIADAMKAQVEVTRSTKALLLSLSQQTSGGEAVPQ